MAGCLIDPDRGSVPATSEPGVVAFSLTLQQNQKVLGKRTAGADTTFSLDTLIIVLTSPGAATAIQRIPISGRPDTGAIRLDTLTYPLPSLRSYKAMFYTIDTGLSPVRRDTVHIDSVTFVMQPASQVTVSKTLSSAYSILRARFIANVTVTTAPIRYLRLKIEGITRDSVAFGDSAAGRAGAYNGLWFVKNGAIGYVVGDGGRIAKSLDSGKTWMSLNSGTTVDLKSVVFPDTINATTDTGYAVGAGGWILRTVNGGASWQRQATGVTTRDLNKVSFVNGTTGYIVGDSLTLLKTVNAGVNWSLITVPAAHIRTWSSFSSGVSSVLRGVHFTSLTAGVAVGDGNVIRQTTTAGASWGTVTPPGTGALHAVRFGTATVGWAVGEKGRILLSTNSGAAWTLQDTNTRTMSTLRSVHATAANLTIAVGDEETILIGTTTNSANWRNVGGGWSRRNMRTATSLNGVHFANGASGFAVGGDGSIHRTADSGVSWTNVGSSSQGLNAVAAFSATSVAVVGNNGLVRSTITGGGSPPTWADVAVTGMGTGTGRGIANTSATIGWFVADSGIFSTANAGVAWTRRRTERYNAVSTGGNRAWVVGNGGVIRRSAGLTATETFTDVVPPGVAIGATNLLGVSFTTGNNNIGYVVGEGGLIAKTVNGSNNTLSAVAWTKLTVPASVSTETFVDVDFASSATVGYVVGASGVILATTDGGTTWSLQYNPTGEALQRIWATTTTSAFVVGDNGTLLRTVRGGAALTTKAVPPRLNAGFVSPTAATRYVVGEGGTILKTANSGLAWTEQNSGTDVELHGVFFTTANRGHAFGDDGTILYTSNGGTTWTSQRSEVGVALRHATFVDEARGWISGDGGVILKTVDTGWSWSREGGGSNLGAHDYHGIHAFNNDSVIAVGSTGQVRKTNNARRAFPSANANLYGAYFRPYDANIGFVVGDGGGALRTGDAGATWTQFGGAATVSARLRSIFVSPSGNNTYVAGDRGTYRWLASTSAADWTVQSSGTTQDLYTVWVSGGGPGNASIFVAGDGGVVRANITGSPSADLVTNISTGTTENLRNISCRTSTNLCWVVGDNETIASSATATSTTWSFRTSGMKLFDELLTHKYLKPGVPTTITLQAIDSIAPLRGYQATRVITIGSGIDSTINMPMTRCGGPNPACAN